MRVRITRIMRNKRPPFSIEYHERQHTNTHVHNPQRTHKESGVRDGTVGHSRRRDTCALSLSMCIHILPYARCIPYNTITSLSLRDVMNCQNICGSCARARSLLGICYNKYAHTYNIYTQTHGRERQKRPTQARARTPACSLSLGESGCAAVVAKQTQFVHCYGSETRQNAKPHRHFPTRPFAATSFAGERISGSQCNNVRYTNCVCV